ncbi:pilus assembly protein TadG-related protein [Streptomyces sp. NPDC005878]|uniref:pilus assembly protein TadG-related protein n=1 Tax=Streptomyces sp. NPDC005878 TaxID=3157077 RepID=UPI0033FC2E9A
MPRATRRLTGDRGQAFPVYITAVAGLLFLAFAYFAVGQAATKRNEAETAADAAALAAAQDFRDQLRKGLLGGFDLVRWQKLLDGDRGGLLPHDSCPAARELAARNDATAGLCELSFQPEPTYRVAVQTNRTAGHSVIAATQDHKGAAKAAAVVVPRCHIRDASGTGPTTLPAEPGPAPEPGESPGPDGPGDEPKGAYVLVCEKKKDFEVDPAHLELLPKASDLFSVHLADK